MRCLAGSHHYGTGSSLWAGSPVGWEPVLLCYARHDDMMCGILGIYSLSLELTVVDLLFFRDWRGRGMIVSYRWSLCSARVLLYSDFEMVLYSYVLDGITWDLWRTMLFIICFKKFKFPCNFWDVTSLVSEQWFERIRFAQANLDSNHCIAIDLETSWRFLWSIFKMISKMIIECEKGF